MGGTFFALATESSGVRIICYRTFFLFCKALQSIRNLAMRNRFMTFEMLINK